MRTALSISEQYSLIASMMTNAKNFLNCNMHRCYNEYTGKKSVPHIQEAHAFTDGAGAFSEGAQQQYCMT